MKQTDFARTLTRYLTDFLPGQRNVSSNTINSYRDTFKQLLLYLGEEYDIRPEFIKFESLNADRIRCFMAWLEIPAGATGYFHKKGTAGFSNNVDSL